MKEYAERKLEADERKNPILDSIVSGMEARPLVFGQISKVMAGMQHIEKTKQQGGLKFAFRGIDDLYNALQKLMAKHELINVPTRVEQISALEITSRNGGKGYHYRSLHTFTWYAADGSSIETQAIGESISYDDKGSNKNASIAHKYILLQSLAIPTEEVKDPDAEQAHKEEREITYCLERCRTNYKITDDELLAHLKLTDIEQVLHSHIPAIIEFAKGKK